MPFLRARRTFPDLVTALIQVDSNGSLSAEFIGDPPQPKGKRGYSEIDALVEDVLEAVRDAYQPHLGEATMGFQLAWYPWKESRKAPALDGLKESFLMFEVRQSAGVYEASLAQDSTLTVRVTRLADLPGVLAGKASERWPVLHGTSIPGMIHWNRNLTAMGFSDVSTTQQDASP